MQVKHNEIKQLQAKLVERDKMIQAMKQQEYVYLAQTDNLKVNSKTSCKYGYVKTGVMKTGLQLLCVLLL